MTYAAYLRIYEPLSAFGEPDRSRWAAYVASAARPRRRDSLMVEHAEALRRAIATPQVVIPELESEHADIRHADGITYACPWPPQAAGDLAEVGRWLEDFHPYSLVELDYGGLVHLVSDDALCDDQSVAEIRVGIDGAARGECELAAVMNMRAHNRWRAFAEFELAN
jgi:hypothetical protein